MNSGNLRFTVPAAVLFGLALTPALAQRHQATPEQRIERLERQVQQVQRRVFPQGQPADTAGFYTEPAATQASVSNLDNRIGALERQLANFLRQSEENAFRVSQLESELARLRRQEERLLELEQRLAAISVAERPTMQSETGAGQPRAESPSAPALRSPASAGAQESSIVAAESDPAEEAYDLGYRLWRDGKYDQAITALRAMASSFPRHRRASWANNLAGRAMLDKGESRAAAEALLANYRSNPKGERAADSLFYLGQALMKLGQSAQACKAYAELEAVFGSSMRGELQTLLPKAKAEAKCA
jgi:TolA-binding protein